MRKRRLLISFGVAVAVILSIVVYKLTTPSSDAKLVAENIVDTTSHQVKAILMDQEEGDLEFAKTGKTVSDFVSAPFVIAMEAKVCLMRMIWKM